MVSVMQVSLMRALRPSKVKRLSKLFQSLHIQAWLSNKLLPQLMLISVNAFWPKLLTKSSKYSERSAHFSREKAHTKASDKLRSGSWLFKILHSKLHVNLWRPVKSHDFVISLVASPWRSIPVENIKSMSSRGNAKENKRFSGHCPIPEF